jgi:hypothetical protein
MPRDGLGNFTAYAPPVVTQTTIDSGVHNGLVADFVTDANAKRPIIAGGTGASSAKEARANLQAEVAGAQVTNYDDHVFENGSFYSAIAATAAPNATDYFVGTAIILTPPNVSLVLVARSVNTGAPYVRIKTGGTWMNGGAWAIDGAGEYVNATGDVMTGHLALPTGPAANHAVRKDYVDAQDALKVAKDYVDAQDALKVAKAGDTMNGDLILNGNLISGGDIRAAGSPTPAIFTYDTATLSGWGFWNDGAVMRFGTLDAVGTPANTFMTIDINGVVSSAKALRAIAGGVNAAVFASNTAAGSSWGFWNDGAIMRFGGLDFNGSPTAGFMSLDATNFVTSGGAFKPGGGVWSDSSDARIKTVLGNYENGLDAILQLQPVRFTFKGNDTPPDAPPETRKAAPYGNSPHYNQAAGAKEFIGLIAQDAEVPMPEMVAKRTAMIDGQPVSDMRDLDMTPLLFALVNAVKALSARLEALEAQPP